MRISSFGMQNAYFENTGTQRGTRTAVNPVEALKRETASGRVRDSLSLSNDAKPGAFGDVLSLQEKKEATAAYAKELEDARINDPVKYQNMINQRAADNVKSLDQLIKLVQNGQNTTAYQNVHTEVNGDNKKIVIGGGSSGRIINVELTNGWALEFDRDADLSTVIDLFSPEDLKRIMEAIIRDNMCQSSEEELENAKESVGELLNQDQTNAVNKTTSEQITEKSSQNDEKEEEAQTSSQIIVNADGSRQLLMTTKIGDMEVLTKIELSPAKATSQVGTKQDLFDEELFDEKPLEDQSEMVTVNGRKRFDRFEEQIRPLEFQLQNALNAYEANFMYA